jgi:hypothetical protein
MMPESPNPPPISPDELIKIKHDLEPGSYQRVEVPGAIVLVIRSGMDYPDIVNDVEAISDELEPEEIDGLTDVCIVGDLEIVGIKLEVINTIMEKRMGEDAKIVEDLYNKLQKDYDILLFESEHDAHKKLRLGIRVPMDIKSLKSTHLPEILTRIDLPARKARVVYIIADDDYLRFYGKKFYQELTEFAAEQTPRTIEEEQDIQNQVRSGMADHFVEDEEEETTFQKTIPDIEEDIENAKPEEEPSEVIQEPESEVEEVALAAPPSSKPQVDEPVSPRPEHEAVETSRVVDILRSTLNKQGFSISTEEIENIDIIANPGEELGDFKRETQIIIKYIENPSLRDLINFEKLIDTFEVNYGILVTPNPTPDAKIFTVGKKLLVVSPEDFEQEVSEI